MRLYINYGTGAGNEFVEGTLEDAKKSLKMVWHTHKRT